MSWRGILSEQVGTDGLEQCPCNRLLYDPSAILPRLWAQERGACGFSDYRRLNSMCVRIPVSTLYDRFYGGYR